MRTWRPLAGWFRSRSAAEQMLLHNLLIWVTATGLVVYLARGLTIDQLVKALERCDLRLFVAANVCSFVIRWLADTYLFARLFSFFHGRTTYREVLPASTAQYFLQAVNVLVADGAMVLFLHKRKGVEWLTAGWTMAFQGFVDTILMAALTVIAALLIPWSPIRVALPYAVAALGFFLCAALWWMRGRPASRPARWLWTGRGMRAFRSAQPYHYGVLGLIRMAIYIPNTQRGRFLSVFCFVSAERAARGGAGNIARPDVRAERAGHALRSRPPAGRYGRWFCAIRPARRTANRRIGGEHCTVVVPYTDGSRRRHLRSQGVD